METHTSVYSASAPAAAAAGSSNRRAPVPGSSWWPAGAATRTSRPARVPSTRERAGDVVAVADVGERAARQRPNASRSVSRSASAWHGWCSGESMFTTGTVACAASSASVASEPVRSPIAATWRERTSAVSRTDSPRVSCSSPGRRTIGWPPSSTIPASNDVRVRVEGCSKISATVRPGERARRGRRRLEGERAVQDRVEIAGRQLGAGEQVARQAGQSRGIRVLTWNLFHGRAVPAAGRPLLVRVRAARWPAGSGTSRCCRRCRRGGRRRSAAACGASARSAADVAQPASSAPGARSPCATPT